MDMDQTITIPLKEYLELKEAYDKRRFVKFERSTKYNSAGNEVAVSSGVQYSIIPSEDSTEEEYLEGFRAMAAQTNSYALAFNTLRKAVEKLFISLLTMNPLQYAGWRRNIAKKYKDNFEAYLNDQLPLAETALKEVEPPKKKREKKEEK